MNEFVLERAIAIARKEVFHILRDPYTLIISLVFPILMVLIYGFAIDFNLKDISLAVSDADKSQTSRRLMETFGSSHYFLLHNVGSPANTVQEVQGERSRATLIIPPRFESALLAGRGANAQILVDGADGSVVASVSSYLSGIQS